MMRILGIVLVLVFACPLWAQDSGSDPVLEVTFDETEAIPGQSLTLRMTVLVPTFLPEPPVWPTLDAPNLMVRLPERSTGPTSASVGGETWSGVTRRYEVSPMVPGEFSIPSQEVVVTYSDPESGDPVQVTLETEPLSFTGLLPDGAEGLDPFIAAEALELEQSVEGSPDALAPGDSVTRTVTARVRGTSPIFLPDLLETAQIASVSAYPEDPVVEQSEERGVLSGTRVESVTYVAKGGGNGDVPGVSVEWYNLRTGAVETATVDGFAIEVSGPPAVDGEVRDWRAHLPMILLALAVLGVGLVLYRWLMPRVAAWRAQRRADYLASEDHAYKLLRQEVSARNMARLPAAIDVWAARVDGPDPRRDPGVQAAMLRLGESRYGTAPQDDPAAWSAVASALDAARAVSRGQTARGSGLPPLNPVS
ncbi:hypothetical protein ACFORG_00925 [Lutimaribacter marinistellae]|uniref:Oxygen tolerance n=1 Tax=Lutimaribacter marinistellae TaxID=1820329 RepID=A0ABV7TE35_9RHOB